jgi:hypothetical protein
LGATVFCKKREERTGFVCMFVLGFFGGGVSSEGFLLVAVSVTAGGREVVGIEELKRRDVK